MFGKAIGAVGALAVTVLAGCSSDDGGTGVACPAGCPPAQCDARTGQCLGQPACTATSTPVRLCGQGCVDLNSDPSNCGACFNSCAGQACTAGQCGGSPTPPPASCSAVMANACLTQDQFCNAGLGVCRPCPGGANAFNCDGLNDCECGNGCDTADPTKCLAGTIPPPTQCSVTDARSCGADTKVYCSANSYTCTACAGVMLNCDYTNTCECVGTTHECDNGACREKATPAKPSTCKDSQVWDGTTCTDCPQFDYDCNADHADGCECLFANDAIGCYYDGTCDLGMD